jgi:hypothetical protein
MSPLRGFVSLLVIFSYNIIIPSGLGVEPVIHIFYNIFIPSGLVVDYRTLFL